MNKRNQVINLIAAYIRKKQEPTPMNIFTANYLRAKYIWGFAKE